MTFGAGGIAPTTFALGVTEFQVSEQATAVLVQPDSKLVLVGSLGQSFAQYTAGHSTESASPGLMLMAHRLFLRGWRVDDDLERLWGERQRCCTTGGWTHH